MEPNKADSGISVIYRRGPLTPADYQEAINFLQDAMTQIKPDGLCCAICYDTGHQAQECRHNPLVMARRAAQAEVEWRCFHCNEVFITLETAQEHFGLKDDDCCLCIATDHPLVVSLRKRIQELMQQLIDGNNKKE
jgi:hypothetical protein